MDIKKVFGVIRKVLGKLTDLLIAGRQSGLWSKKEGVEPPRMRDPREKR